MFASKFDLPEHFGARVTAIHEYVRDSQAAQNTASRRESLAKALIESCELLRDINMGAVAYEVSEIIAGDVSLNDIPLQGLEMEKFLDVERTLLREAGISESATWEIDNLCRQVTRLREAKLSPDNVVDRFSQFQQLVCGQADEAIMRAKRKLRAADIWTGIAGVAVLVTNASAMSMGVAPATVSVGVGGALIGRALK